MLLPSFSLSKSLVFDRKDLVLLKKEICYLYQDLKPSFQCGLSYYLTIRFARFKGRSLLLFDIYYIYIDNK